jgi:hypothetical protein
MAMKKVSVVSGTDKVLRNVNKEVKKILIVSKRRLYACGLLVKNRSVKLTPIKTGNLRGSAYVIPLDSPLGPAVEIGYTAFYAPYVHEMPFSYHFTKTGTGPKFLERALRDSAKEIKSILSAEIL